MEFDFKRLFGICLVLCSCGYWHYTFAMDIEEPSECISSIIRDMTSEEDKCKIRRALNDSILRGTGTIGGGQFYFSPYTFHNDEPREIYVCTIPYLLSDRCPVLRKLVDMLWLTVDAAENYDRVDRAFIDKTQDFVNSFNRKFNVTAEYIDVFEAFQLCFEKKAHPENRAKVRSTMSDLIHCITKKWNEFKKPIVPSGNITAINLLLKLLDGIAENKFLTSTFPQTFHDVFVMAYDTGADNRNFFGRLFGKVRPSVNTCLAWATVGGLDKSTAYHEDRFLKAYERLGCQTREEIERFLKFAKEKSSAQKVADMEVKVRHLEEQIEAHSKEIAVTKEEVRTIKFDVCKMKEAQNDLLGLLQNIEGLRTCINKISHEEGAPDAEVLQCVSESIDAGMHYCHKIDQERSNDEIKKLRKHMVEIKKHVAQHAKKINELMASRDNTLSLYEYLLKAREEWERRAIEIDSFASNLKRDEERLKAISESSTKEFIVEQYKQSGWFAKWRLCGLFPFLKELHL